MEHIVVPPNVPRVLLRRRSSGSSHAGSDHERSPEVPTVDVILDNSLPAEQLKREVLMLILRLKLPRWRSLPISEYPFIKISRISGALTNAVYCVSPPAQYMHPSHRAHHTEPHTPADSGSSQKLPRPKSATSLVHIGHIPQLLLRVYGPNTSQIIDRATELAVLKRLAARNIGPRILGIFTNGRFEQFLKATTLTKEDIRKPEVSRGIAKRMRELHDGVDLTMDERLGGPGLWKNFAKWSMDAKEALDRLDKLVPEDQDPNANPCGPPWTTKKVLMADWPTFMEGARRYKEWLEAAYGGEEAVNKGLVFAHNDAQYGNLLRVELPLGSPLLQPAHEHRALVVIDFEYASPNTRGYDIANHFSEWMADYHHPTRPQDLHSEKFPNLEERSRFIESYVTHTFEDFDELETIDKMIAVLHSEATKWNAACQLGWCVWGIISAKIDAEPEEDEEGFVDVVESNQETAKETLEADPFDYLDHASQRAALFWGELAVRGIPIPEGVDMTRAMYLEKPRDKGLVTEKSE
ncbi:kinase-like domain-containing protein [Myxozyma melibiosi]|uniref:Kinase-like domain-containing protein n=1 Tax=Myxozyma melibiosi TaxID=54550 RepID=A0ABR1FFL1_9ASCO